MSKQTAYYVAGAALASTMFFATPQLTAATNVIPEPDYTLLPEQATIHTFDFAKDGAIRTINFSLPVDPTTIDGNIQLVNVTTGKTVDATFTVDRSNNKAVKVHTTHEEGAQYRLLISKNVKSYGQLVLPLQQAIQFNYIATNVDAPQPITGTISTIDNESITIDGQTYTANSSIAPLFTNNKAALAGANISVTVKNNEIHSIEEIELTASGTKEAPITFNGNDVRLQNTTITVAANNVKLEQATIPNVNIIGNVTNVELNASITTLNIATTSDIEVTGSGKLNKVTIDARKNVTFKTTGKIEQLHVLNDDAHVTLGDNVTIGSVKLPTTSTLQSVITNYDDVQDNVNVNEAAAKLVPVADTYGVANIVLAKPTSATLYYDSYLYYSNTVPLKVGETLIGTEKKWVNDVTVPIQFDVDYMLYKVDANNVVTEVMTVEPYFPQPINVSVQNNIITVQLAAYSKNYTPATIIRNGLYISNGTVGTFLTEEQLAAAPIQYTKDGVAYFTLNAPNNVSFTNGTIYYYINTIGNYVRYTGVSNIDPARDEAVYAQAVYDFANRPLSSKSIVQFNDLLAEANFDKQEVTTADGETYIQHVSRISTLPTIEPLYINAFKDKKFNKTADIQQTVNNINKTYAAAIAQYAAFNHTIDSLYKIDPYSYPSGQRLREHVTEQHLYDLERDIYFDNNLQTDDKGYLYNELSAMSYDFENDYMFYYYDLAEDGTLNEGVTEAQINEAIEKAKNNIPNAYADKKYIISQLESLKIEVYAAPLHALLSNIQADNSRLKASVTKEKLDAVSNEVRQSVATKDENVRNAVEQEITQFMYYYIAREASKLFEPMMFSSYDPLVVKDDVTFAQVDALFEGIDVSSYYSLERLYNVLKMSIALKPVWQYVSKDYFAYETTLSELFTNEMTFDKLQDLHAQLTETYSSDEELSLSIDNWFNTMYDYYFKHRVNHLFDIDLKNIWLYTGAPLKKDVTDAQVDAAIAELQQYNHYDADELVSVLQTSKTYKNIWSLYAPLSFTNSNNKIFQNGVTAQQIIDALSPLTTNRDATKNDIINKVVLDFAAEKFSLIYKNTYDATYFPAMTADNTKNILTADEQRALATELLNIVNVLKPTNGYDLNRLTSVLQSLINDEPARDIQSNDAPFWTTLPSYNAVAPFILANEYGVTFAEDVSIDALEDFAQDVYTANADEAAKALLLATIDDAMTRAQHQAFTSITVQ